VLSLAARRAALSELRLGCVLEVEEAAVEDRKEDPREIADSTESSTSNIAGP